MMVANREQKVHRTAHGVEKQVVIGNVFADFGVLPALHLQRVHSCFSFIGEWAPCEKVAAYFWEALKVRNDILEQACDQAIESRLGFLLGYCHQNTVRAAAQLQAV